MTGEEDFLSPERNIIFKSKTTCFGVVQTISSHGRDVIYEGKTSCFTFKGMGEGSTSNVSFASEGCGFHARRG